MEEVALPLVSELAPMRGTPESQLTRFSSPYRSVLRALTRIVPRTEDLLFTFPGLAFALATGYGPAGGRERALRTITGGGNLRTASDSIELPWWTRKLPPEAFTQNLTPMPDGVEFSRRIVNHVPREPWRTVSWLRRVQVAHDLVDADFALWIAWRTKSAPRLREMSSIVLLAAWAWYSRQPGTTGHRLIRSPFDSLGGFRKGLEEADNWKKRVDLAVALGQGIEDTWYEAGIAQGYLFHPLRTIDDFLGEAATMRNCLDQYGRRVSLRTTRVFSIRREGLTVADLEIGPHDDDCTMPKIEQLRGPSNQRVTPAIWQATYAWLGQQKPRGLPNVRSATTHASIEVARDIWRPFHATTARNPSHELLRQYLKSGEVVDPEL